MEWNLMGLVHESNRNVSTVMYISVIYNNIIKIACYYLLLFVMFLKFIIIFIRSSTVSFIVIFKNSYAQNYI